MSFIENMEMAGDDVPQGFAMSADNITINQLSNTPVPDDPSDRLSFWFQKNKTSNDINWTTELQDEMNRYFESESFKNINGYDLLTGNSNSNDIKSFQSYMLILTKRMQMLDEQIDQEIVSQRRQINLVKESADVANYALDYTRNELKKFDGVSPEEYQVS